MKAAKHRLRTFAPRGAAICVVLSVLLSAALPGFISIASATPEPDSAATPCCSQEDCGSTPAAEGIPGPGAGECCPNHCHGCYLPCCGQLVGLRLALPEICLDIIVSETIAAPGGCFQAGYPSEIQHPPLAS